MKRSIRGWSAVETMIVVAVIAIVCAIAIPGISRIRRRVERVVDGDTIIMLSEECVRISNIDAPEENEPGYGKATTTLRLLIEGKSVRLKREGKDKYGRTLARVYLDDCDVGQMMIDLEVAREWVNAPE